MRYYLAYGSNLNLKAMKARCRSAKVIGKSELKDYMLVFKGSCDDYSYLTLEEKKGEAVPVVIYEISFFDELALNKYEGYPKLYLKSKINLKINGIKRNVIFYIMKEGFDYHLPSIAYFNSCMQGYKDFEFDVKYLEDAFNNTVQNMA